MRTWLMRLNRRPEQPTLIEPAAQRYLKARYSAEVASLSAFMNRDLSLWCGT